MLLTMMQNSSSMMICTMTCIPSRHITLKRRRTDVDATWRRRFDDMYGASIQPGERNRNK